MKRNLFIFIIILLFAAIGWSAWKYWGEKKEAKATFIEEKNNYDQLPSAIGVSEDKIWTIDFNEKLKSNTINNKSVFVVDNDNNKIPVSLEVDGKSVHIQPPSQLYQQGEGYTLYVEDTVEFQSDDKLEKPMKMEFIIQREQKEEVELNPNIKKLSITDVRRLDEEKAELVITPNTEGLKEGDIVFFPPNRRDPLQQEQARKITSIVKKEGIIETHTTMPRFTELIEKIDIYKEIEFKAENFIPNPEFEITAEDVATLPSDNLVASLTAASPKKQADLKLIDEEKGGKKFEREISEKKDSKKLQVKDTSNSIKLTGGPIKWKVKGKPFELNVTTTMYKPSTIWDVEASFLNIKRMNIGIENKLSFGIDTQFGMELGMEDEAKVEFKKELTKADAEEKKILLGTMAVPIAPPVIASVDVYAYAHINVNGEIGLKVAFENSQIATISKQKNKEFLFSYQNKVNDGKVSLRGTASIDERLGFMVKPELSIAKAVGVGMELKGSVYEEGTIITDMNHEKMGDGCYKVEGGVVGSASAAVDVATKFVLYEKELGERKFKKDFFTLDECSKKKFNPVIIAKPKELRVNPNDTVDVQMILGYFDYESFEYKEEELPKNKVTFTSSSPESIQVNQEGKVHITENPKKKDGSVKATYKLDEQILTTEVPVKIKISETNVNRPEQSDKEMQNYIMNLFRKIQPIVFTGETYAMDPAALPPFETVQGSLKAFATDNYINNKLSKAYKASIGWLDTFGIPYSVEPTTVKVLKQGENEREYEWIINDESDGISKFFIRIKKENGTWKIDDCQKFQQY